MLGLAMGIPPSSVQIHRTVHGKPLLDRDDLHFSLAHARGAVAVALARRPAGIDIERKTALPDIDRIAATALAPDSRRALDAVKGAARLDLFYRFWTLGEAFIKATGLGLFQNLDSFAFTPNGEPRLTRVSSPWGPAERWRFGFC
jgi:phosphopantetheinyl transferase